MESRYYRLHDEMAPVYTGGMKLRLKELRLEKGLTQRQVAEMAGMSVSYYTELELGRKQINANRLEGLAKVFGVTPKGLIAGSDAKVVTSLDEKLALLPPESRVLVENLIHTLASGHRPGE